ncbi:DUF4136 domain-containing protein [Psychromonas sp. MB-3u-54]|uniref:DUF4136 domain-containing protein n=1 Tax=Psychromonas sp. MB-3u-54 TaxID=2058319 RepID=UPI000C34E7C5|nr:DUF4136 domain-containing protein [Psychromonas sp. MB-3u-54]PKH04491.1 DUF4136 domain-containing protein [Psychromonas sp. MB-3u-54]
MSRIIILVLLSLSVLACSVKPATDYVIDHDFSQYQHFAFVATPKDGLVSIDSPRIEHALITSLGEKGIRQTTKEQADLLVNYHIDSATELESYGSQIGVGIFSGGGSIGMRSPIRYRERHYGKLVIEFLNPTSQSIVWRSISQSPLLETMGTVKRAEFITVQIELMLSNFPPKDK